MVLYIGRKPYSKQDNLFHAIKNLSLQEKSGYYFDDRDNTLYFISYKNGIVYIKHGKNDYISLQSDILLTIENLGYQKVIRVIKETIEDSILNFLSKESMNKIEMAIVGGSYIENQFYVDKNVNILKVLSVLVNYQRSDVVINNSHIYDNINSRKLTKEESKILNKKPFIYGSSTTLTFLAVAATLYFSSSNPIAQMAALIFTVAAALIFAGLTVGLVTHYCMKPNQKLEDIKTAKNTKNQEIIENLK